MSKRIERDCGCVFWVEVHGWRVVPFDRPCKKHLHDAIDGRPEYITNRPRIVAYLKERE